MLRRAQVGHFAFSEGVHAQGTVLPWHSHPVPTVCFVLEGGFTELSGGHAVSCMPSTLKFMPAGERHCDRFSHGPARGLLVEVDREEASRLRKHAAVLDRRVHYQGGEPAELAFRIHRELVRMDDASCLAIEGLMLELLAVASRITERSRSSRVTPWLSQAREIIDAGPGGTLGVSGVALAVGVHPATLARGFRRVFGCTMGEYVRRRRIERAMTQLRATPMPISEIALTNGFADQSHFSNLFRRQVGISPSVFRRLAASR
jgi:AraC family transcriptional regulator